MFFNKKINELGTLIKERIAKHKVGYVTGLSFIALGLDLASLLKGSVQFAFFISVIAILFILLKFLSHKDPETNVIENRQADSSDMEDGWYIALLVAIGALIASSIILISNVLIGKNDTRSILLELLYSTKHIEYKDLGFRTQFSTITLKDATKHGFKAVPIWPVPEKELIKKCIPVESTLQHKLVTIKADSCDVFYIYLKPVPLTEATSLYNHITTISPSVNITFSDGHQATFILHQLANKISLTLSKQLSEQQRKLRASKNFENEQRRLKELQKQEEFAINAKLLQREKDLKNSIKCSFSGCEIDTWTMEKYLCGTDAKKIYFRKSTLSNEFVIDLERACVEISPNRFVLKENARCVSVPDNIPSLKPLEIILVRIEFETEEKIEFPVSVTKYRGPPGSTIPKIVLEPAKGENQENTPYAIAWLDPYLTLHPFPYRVRLGIGACNDLGGISGTILIDSDGMGLIEYDRGMQQLSTPEPKNGIITLAFETPEGRRYGPYHYVFNVDEIIQNAATISGVPKLFCRSHKNKELQRKIFSCEIPGEPNTILDWLKVKSIRIGKVQNNLDLKFDVNMTTNYISKSAYLKGFYTHEKTPGPLVKFNPPNEWSNLYYQLTLNNGSVLPIQRIALD
ncbi:hypothetical protein [Nitrosomonas mobilis]|uniref:Uncharacterized protein n=1 Tax=Nitrosomonas mobilis TaxID=51642 RepID=A0A1G5SFD2_9PROT|nr:hypothetical protein [Nitrosomonas mobilis]SCZ85906.1 membrane hypothetical protein [Nitrosomonas mobilis]